MLTREECVFQTMIASLKASGRRASTLVARCACQIGSWPWRSSKVETVRYYCVGRYYGVAIRLNGSLLTNKEIVWEELVNFRQPRGRRYGPPARYRARPARACQFGRQLGGQIHIVQRVGYRAIQFHPSLHTVCASNAIWFLLHSILYQFPPPSPAALPPPPGTPSTWPR